MLQLLRQQILGLKLRGHGMINTLGSSSPQTVTAVECLLQAFNIYSNEDRYKF